MATAIPTAIPIPSTNPSPSILNNVLSPATIAGIVISIALTITLFATLCWCCCCRHSSASKHSRPPSKPSLGRQSPVSGLDSSTSELGLVQEPASMLDMDSSSGPRPRVEEPPPPYYTLEHRAPLPPAVPVEMGVVTRRGPGAEEEEGVEAWNGFQFVSGAGPGVDSRTVSLPHEATAVGPATGRNVSLRADTDVKVVSSHARDENVEEGEEEG